MILALPLLLAAAWALCARKPSEFMWYLFAQIVYIPAIYGTAWAYGQDSRAYLWTYAGMTGLVLAAAVLVAWNALRGRIYKLRASALALILSVCLGRLSFMGLRHAPRLEDWLVLLEAVVLLWCGTLTAYVASYRRERWAFFTLGIMWLGYALWDFGLILHHPAWMVADWYVPSAWLTCGFTVLGFLLRVSHGANTALRERSLAPNK